MHYYTRQTESELWTVGYGDGKDWTPVKDYGNYREAVEAAERLNNPTAYKLIDEMRQEISDLKAQLRSTSKEE